MEPMKIQALSKRRKLFLMAVIVGALAWMVIAEERAFERHPCPARDVPNARMNIPWLVPAPIPEENQGSRH